MALSLDDRLLTGAVGDGTVILWEMATGKQLHILPAQQTVLTGTQAVAFAPDDKILATIGRTVRLWEVITGKPTVEFGPRADLLVAVAYLPDGKSLAVAGPDRVSLWDPTSGKEIRSWPAGMTRQLAFSLDGRFLVWYEMERVVVRNLGKR